MAHAGSGSASGSAVFGKGGILKFADVVRERFRGPAFGQDFTTWLEEVKWGFDTGERSRNLILAIRRSLPNFRFLGSETHT